MEFLVNLNRVEDVKTFVGLAGTYGCDIMVKNMERGFTVDGGSIMGMFSLDLSKPVIVHIEDEKTGRKFKKDVEKFVVE